MKIYTVFDDGFLEMAKGFFRSLRYYSDVPACAYIPSSAKQAAKLCDSLSIPCISNKMQGHSAKQTSRILKMGCPQLDLDEDNIAYMDIDIIFQGDIAELGDLNPDCIWVLSKREGHQTSLRTWKKHYFVERTVEFARKNIPLLDGDLDVEAVLQSPVRNCGVIYGRRSLLTALFDKAKEYYLKLLKINTKRRIFSDSDQLCFLLAFEHLKENIQTRELPLRFNRMPYHQSYDYKDKSSLLVPDNIVLHLNRRKGLGTELISSWSKNQLPNIAVEDGTRSGIVIPIQTSSIAERSLMKNLYSLAVSNRANVYRDEDVGFPIQKRITILNQIRDSVKHERPALDNGLFFMLNGFLFMIDHGEYTGSRAQWIIGKHATPDQLAGIFIEQMDKDLDVSQSKIPIIPVTYGTKYPDLWINQGKYHHWGLSLKKRYSVYFLGNLTTNKKRREKCASLIQSIPESKIEHKSNQRRLSFDLYMQEMASSHIVWCPPGGRPKTHREIEAMCCEVAVMMPEQHIQEPESLVPNTHYIQVEPDHSDAVAQVKDYLKHPERLSEIARNGRLWYERNASDYARAEYIHIKCLEIIKGIRR